jgi:glycerol-3-phosphate dehydrogenase
LISVLGVKYTTAREVAQRAIDLAAGRLARKTKHCRTHTQPVKGGQIAYFESFLKQAIADARGVIDKQVLEHLIYTYGSEYRQLEKYNLARLDSRLPVTEAEVIHAVREEMALTLLDVIQRRTDLGSAGLPSMKTLQRCAELMSRELGWTLERQQAEINSVTEAYPFKPIERVTA